MENTLRFQSVERSMKRLWIIIDKQKIFLGKIKRTGSNLKKERILQGLYSSLYSASHLYVLQIQTVIRGPLQQRNIGLVLVVPYAGKEKSITFSSFFHTIKVRKSWEKETDNWMLLSCKKNCH